MKEQRYYFTFGSAHGWGGRYIVFTGKDENEAREKMFKHFGPKWAFCYDEEHWNKADGTTLADEWGWTEITLEEIQNG